MIIPSFVMVFHGLSYWEIHDSRLVLHERKCSQLHRFYCIMVCMYSYYTYQKFYGQHSTIYYWIIQQVLYGLDPSIRPITWSIKEKQNSSHIRSSKTSAIKGGHILLCVFVQCAMGRSGSKISSRFSAFSFFNNRLIMDQMDYQALNCYARLLH